MTTTTSRPATRGESCTNCGDPETTYCLDSTPTVDQWAAARATVPPPMITLLSRVLLRARAGTPSRPLATGTPCQAVRWVATDGSGDWG
jgi:hypothetical protein